MIPGNTTTKGESSKERRIALVSVLRNKEEEGAGGVKCNSTRMVVFIGKTQKCVVIAILAILGTAGVTSGAGAAASATVAPGIGGRSPLVFRVQGSGCDPEYSRACGVVRGLEDLYGKERYRLHQVHVYAIKPADRHQFGRVSWARIQTVMISSLLPMLFPARM